MKAADRLMYAYDFRIMYLLYALCRKNMKRFVNSETAPFGVMYDNSKTVHK